MSTSECWLEIMPNQHKPFDFFGWSRITCFSYSLATSKHLEESIYEKDLSVFYLMISPLHWKASCWHIFRDSYQVTFPLLYIHGKCTQCDATNHHSCEYWRRCCPAILSFPTSLGATTTLGPKRLGHPRTQVPEDTSGRSVGISISHHLSLIRKF